MPNQPDCYDPAIPDNTPIIVGVGQVTEPVPEDLQLASSHADLAAQACQQALADTGVSELAQQVDTLVAVRTFADSGSLGSCPFGMPNNLPRAIAKRLGADPERAVYGVLGGETPQKLTSEFCELLINRDENLSNHEHKLVLITGAEVIANIRAAKRQGVTLDWSEQVEGQLEDRGVTGGYELFGAEETRHGITNAMPYYALMENARRGQLGQDVQRYSQAMGELFAHYAEIADNNPLSFFKGRHTAQELVTPGERNPLLIHPYTRHLIAKDGVNQTAAILLTTAGHARKLRIDPNRWVFLHGYSNTTEQVFMARADLGKSPAMTSALNSALANANITAEQINHLDLYSCFPIVPELARQTLAISAGDRRELTVTGGLPFFGGPGNNYTLHGIASMVERLRQHPGEFGLVYGNGGWMSKHSVGIYSTTPPQQRPLQLAQRNSDKAVQQQLDAAPRVPLNIAPEGEATLESFTVSYRNHTPKQAIVIGRLKASGERFIAVTAPDEHYKIQELLLRDPLQETIWVYATEQGNRFEFTPVAEYHGVMSEDLEGNDL